MRGQHDRRRRQRRHAPLQLADDVLALRFFVLRLHRQADRARKRGAAGLAVAGVFDRLLEREWRAREDLARPGLADIRDRLDSRLRHDRRAVGQQRRHRRLRAVALQPLPRLHLRVLGAEHRDHADGAVVGRHPEFLRRRRVMGLHLAREGRRRVVEDEGELAVDVEALVVVVAEVRRGHPEAREDHTGREREIGIAAVGRDDPLVWNGDVRHGHARRGDVEPRADERASPERHLLEPRPVVGGGLEPVLRHLRGDVVRCDVVAAGPRLASLEHVVCQELDMRADAGGGKIGLRRRRRRRRDNRRDDDHGKKNRTADRPAMESARHGHGGHCASLSRRKPVQTSKTPGFRDFGDSLSDVTVRSSQEPGTADCADNADETFRSRCLGATERRRSRRGEDREA